MTYHRLEELRPDQLERRLAEKPVLVLPFGTIEWHSYHLPLGLDGLVADDVGSRIAAECDAVLAPTSYWAVGGVPYPHTLNLPIDLVEPLLRTLFEQFAEMGFEVIVGFTGHFGLDQTLALKRAAVEVMRRSPATVVPLTAYDVVTDLYPGDHAAVGETSMLLASRPELVDLQAVPDGQPLDGVLGDDPRGRADGARGAEIRDAVVSRTAAVVDRLLGAERLARRQYVEALAAGVAALADLADRRSRAPKSTVPPVATPTYLSHCGALWAGDYGSARQFAEQKRLDPAI